MRLHEERIYGLALSLLFHQHYQDRLHAVEKYLSYVAIDTLIYEKQRNVGILNAHVYPCYLPQASKYTTKKTEEHILRNNTA